MPEHRRSILQTMILLRLEEKPAKSITELAVGVGSQRPSVSRSLNALREQGLVCRTRSGWQLTEEGRPEAVEAKAALLMMKDKVSNMAERASEVLGRAFRDNIEIPKVIDTINGLVLHNNSRISAALSAAFDSTKLINTVGILNESGLITDVVKSLGQSNVIRDVFQTMGEAIKPLALVQERNSQLLGDMVTSARFLEVVDVLKPNNLLLAGAIDDLFAIRQAEMSHLAIQVTGGIDFSWVSEHLTLVNQSFENLFRQHVGQIDFSHFAAASLAFTERVSVPTVAVASYNHSLRNFIDAETQADFLLVPERHFEEVGDQSLDPLLRTLSPDFVEMRHGAWAALRFGGPDRLRHAGTSQRELLGQLLKYLIPDIQLPEDNRQGPQIKARVRIALGASESDAAFIDALAKAVYEYYNQLNKYTHHNEKHEESLRAILRTGEGLIRFILAIAGISQ